MVHPLDPFGAEPGTFKATAASSKPPLPSTPAESKASAFASPRVLNPLAGMSSDESDDDDEEPELEAGGQSARDGKSVLTVATPVARPASVRHARVYTLSELRGVSELPRGGDRQYRRDMRERLQREREAEDGGEETTLQLEVFH